MPTLVSAQYWSPSSLMTLLTLWVRWLLVVLDGKRRAAEKWRFSRTDRVPITTSSYNQTITATSQLFSGWELATNVALVRMTEKCKGHLFDSLFSAKQYPQIDWVIRSLNVR